MTCNRRRRLLAAWMVGTILAAASAGASAETANCLVAVVNDDVITLHELHKKMKEMTGIDPGTLKERSRQQYNDARRMILERLIEDRIALEKIREIGIEVKDSEVDDAIERIKRDNHWSQKELEATLRDKGLTWEEYREKVREDLQRYKLVNFEVKSRIIIRDERIEAYYEEHKERFQRKPGVEIATIFLLREGSGKDGSVDPERRAASLVRRIREGSDFGELAREHSDGPGAGEGGYLGRFDPKQLEPEIRKVIEQTPEGGVSDPIIKPNGVQIIKVLDKGGTGLMPLEKVRDAIYRILLREEIDRRYVVWIEEPKARTYTKVLFD